MLYKNCRAQRTESCTNIFVNLHFMRVLAQMEIDQKGVLA
jgi:hypothetical protein